MIVLIFIIDVRLSMGQGEKEQKNKIARHLLNIIKFKIGGPCLDNINFMLKYIHINK